MRKKVVILGAGLAGLSAAWVLARNGFEVVILEKTAINGGLAVTKSRDGYSYDLGPHNIHTVHRHIVTFLKRRFAGTLIPNNPGSKILKRNRFISYPLRGLKVITTLPPWRVPVAIASLLLARMRMFFGEPEKDASFEDWIVNRFGRSLYGEYFGNYAGKVWGISPSTIDRYVAEKRVPIINLTELIRAALLGKTARVNHPEFVDENYYLRRGIGELAEFFEKGARELGIRIENESRPVSIGREGDRVTNVTWERGGDSRQEACDFLLSTIPLNESVALFGDIPSDVREAAAGLDYCSAVLLFLKIARRGVLPSSMLYFSDPAVKFSRIYDVGTYSAEMVPNGKTMLCLEFPCNLGDATWNTSGETLALSAAVTLEESGVLRPGDIEGAFSEKVSHSYPRFRLGFQDRVRTCFDFFARHENFISYGRQGSFAYLNTDGVISLGFCAADAVLISGSMGYRCQEWFGATAKFG